MKLIKRLRIGAYKRQNGRCIYCETSMWDHAIEAPKHAAERFGLTGAPNKTLRLTRIQCSAEHVVRTSDGGRTTADNIVAACRLCNYSRGSMDPIEFKALAMSRTKP
jgi:5-methylcytosine-specific restriction endonuclease McrA